MLISDIPIRNARFYPDRVAAVNCNDKVTFHELNKRINRLANALGDLGVKAGDRVAMLQHNTVEYLDFYFATAKLGAISVPLNYRSVGTELADVLNDAEAQILIVGSDYAEGINEVRSSLKHIKEMVCLGVHQKGMVDYYELTNNASMAEPSATIDEDDLAILMYTGGTTGRSKGVMLTHKNVISNCINQSLELGVRGESIFFGVPPALHAGCACWLFSVLYIGGCFVMIPSFDPSTVLSTIEKYRVTHVLLVPAMIERLLQHPDFNKFDISSLRMVVYGTAPMSFNLIGESLMAFKCQLQQGYGATETFVLVSSLPPEDHVLEGPHERMERMKSAGREILNVKVRVVDDNDQDVAIGELGEIVVRGNNIMKGYWNLPELTKEVLRGGWYHTGDIAKIDGDGYLYIVDRKKDMIISGGENIYPKEIEAVLSLHPVVQEVAIIGVPDKKWGEVPKAIVTLKEGKTVSEETLISFCEGKLARFKIPKSVEFRDSLPRTTVGKVSKAQLREKYWQGYDRRVS